MSCDQKRIACAVLALFLCAVTVQAARLGVAGLIIELAQREIDHWITSQRGRGLAEVDRVAGFFEDSLAFEPDNPWALEGAAALDLARMRLSVASADALGHAARARGRYREALLQRPTSPYLWANLALAKLYMDQRDAEFMSALRNADELGPWEPRSQQIFLFVSLAAWDKLDAGQRRAAALAIERGGVHNALKMFEIVKSYGRFDLACGLKDYDAVAGAACAKAAPPARSNVPIIRGQR